MKGSLRARLFGGALVWMIAVFGAVTALLITLGRNHPELAITGRTYHATIAPLATASAASGCDRPRYRGDHAD